MTIEDPIDDLHTDQRPATIVVSGASSRIEESSMTIGIPELTRAHRRSAFISRVLLAVGVLLGLAGIWVSNLRFEFTATAILVLLIGILYGGFADVARRSIAEREKRQN